MNTVRDIFFVNVVPKDLRLAGIFELFLANFCAALIFIVLMSTIFQVKAST